MTSQKGHTMAVTVAHSEVNYILRIKHSNDNFKAFSPRASWLHIQPVSLYNVMKPNIGTAQQHLRSILNYHKASLPSVCSRDTSDLRKSAWDVPCEAG